MFVGFDRSVAWPAGRDVLCFSKVMGSGMTTSTAMKGRSCEGFIHDDVGLRTPGECDIVLDPNFGFLQVLPRRDQLR